MIDIEKSYKAACEFHAGMKKYFSNICKTGVVCHEFPDRQGEGRSMFLSLNDFAPFMMHTRFPLGRCYFTDKHNETT